MRRRLLNLCLLAYPRLCRERDRDYLRDLALELSETYGWRRQAWSLLRGGLGERVEGRRLSGDASLSAWGQRVAVACSLFAAVALAASSLTGLAVGAGERVGVDWFACTDADHSRSNRDGASVAGPSGCAEAHALVAARRRAGWECTTRRHSRDGQAIAWRCTLREEFVARSPL